MKKAVAIQYVIMLILGVVVISILAYWFISQSGKTTEGGLKVECESKQLSYCIQWSNSRSQPSPDFLKGCPLISKSDECKSKFGISIT